MLGLYVSVPIACFRKGLAREYLETEALPPPSTCYGFLLSMIGETERRRHIGCRVTPVLLGTPPTSVVLRTVWRVKKVPLGSSGNTRPDYQQLLTEVKLVIWLDSTEETSKESPNLESRVLQALSHPSSVTRFGGLSLGESTHLVDEVTPISRLVEHEPRKLDQPARAFLVRERGRFTLPTWVDHVGSSKTRYATGDLVEWSAKEAPHALELPQINPEY